VAISVLWKNLKHRTKTAANALNLVLRYDVLIEPAVTVKYWRSISFGEKCTLQSCSYVYGSRRGLSVEFGNHVVVAHASMILGEGGVEIGDFTHLGPQTVLTTQYGDSRSESRTSAPSVKYAKVKIGAGCWIGSGSVIMPGTILGDRCIVSPNSVVFGRWRDGTVLSGNPARAQKR